MLPKKTMTAEQLKADYPELYTELTSMHSQKIVELTAQVTDLNSQITKQTTELSKVQSENAKLLKHQTIRTNAQRLGLTTYAEELIKQDKSLEESLTSLIEKRSIEGPETNELSTVFKKTGTKPAGNSSSDDVTAPKTWEEAKLAMSKINPELKGAALAKAARRQFQNIDFTAIEEE